MSKSLRNSPLALAAAALAAAPSAAAQPIQLTPPPAAAREMAPPQRGAPLIAPQPSAVAQIEQPPAELRGPVGPLPQDFSLVPQPASPPAPPPAPPAPPPVQQAQRPAPAPSASVTAGEQENFTRLAFRFPGGASVTPALSGNRLDLRFSRAADIDIAELRATPPRFVREIRRVSAAGQPLRLALTLDPGVRQRNFADGDRVIVDLLAPEEQTQQQAAQSAASAAPAPARPPVTGTARVQLEEGARDTRIRVTWPAPARAAAFRRGEAVWLLFDASGQINLTGVARAGRRHQDIEIVRGDGVIGLRIPAPPDVLVSASAEGDAWVFDLSPRADVGETAPTRREGTADGRGRIVADFGRDGVVRWVNDPEIGDRIAVAMLGGPSRGVGVRRATMEAALLPAAHGAVIEPRADGVAAAFDNGALVVTRGDGLLTTAPPSPLAAANAAALEAALANVGAEPIGDNGMSMREIRERIDDLTRRAADEGVREGAPVQARMALARFLLQNEYAPEALGALRIVAINQGELAELDPDYRLMRGAANVMMGRSQDARADLDSSALLDDPSAALWRGYAAYLKQDWPEARRELERGAGALEQHPPGWRARFQLALGRAALELNDYATAQAAAQSALGQAQNQHVRLEARLIEARLKAAQNDPAGALTMLDELARVRDEEVAVRATLEGLRIRRDTGVMRAVDAAEMLEALRYRWRGDSVELATVGMLGDVYSEQGRWREALSAMRVAADRFPSDPAARRLRQDMTTLFERLFLDGEADQLEPIQALGLFYEFSDLTPVGPNGDRIVRLLAGRLVHVDLLEQAAQLLQHQVDERLQGIGKAQVAADLAAIYLMDSQPERALAAINSSRQPNMPPTLVAERRILEARAMLGLGRLDHAVELVERDRSQEAQSVRAEAAWRARDWPRAAADLRTLLSMRDRAVPFDATDRQTVLRAGIALTLAGNEEGVRALYREYAGEMAGADEADSFEVIAAGVNAEGAAIRDLARVVARTDLLDRFIARLRTRMTEQAAAADAAQGGPDAPPPAPAPAPAAAPPPAQQQRPPQQQAPVG